MNKPDLSEYLELIYNEFVYFSKSQYVEVYKNGLYPNNAFDYSRLSKTNKLLLDILYVLRRHYVLSLKGQKPTAKHYERVKNMDKIINTLNPVNLVDYYYCLKEWF